MKRVAFFLISALLVGCVPPPPPLVQTQKEVPKTISSNSLQEGTGASASIQTQTGTVLDQIASQVELPPQIPVSETEQQILDMSLEKELSTISHTTPPAIPIVPPVVNKKPVPAGQTPAEKVVALSDLEVRSGVLYTRGTNTPFSGKVVSFHPNSTQKSQEGVLLNGRRDGVWSFFDQQGKKWAEGSYKDGRPVGKLIRWHPNGQKREEGNFVSGLMDGLWSTWNMSGQLIEEKNYKAGIREGKFTLWYDNGQKKEEKNYKSGNVEGKFFQWYDNGQPLQEANYLEGNLDGKFISWYPNGQKKTEGVYVRGKMEGKWTLWHSNGIEQEFGSYMNGKKHGTWRFWNELGEDLGTRCFDAGVEKNCRLPEPNVPSSGASMPTSSSPSMGNMSSVSCPTDYSPVCGADGKTYPNSCLALQFYKVVVVHEGACVSMDTALPPVPSGTPSSPGGKIVPWAQWWPNGVKKEEGILKNGLKEGKWVLWHSSGTKAEEGNYVLGQREGMWTFWHKNGQKKDEGNYTKGKKNGFWTSWYENGQKMQEGNYENGVQKGLWMFWYSNGNKRGEKTY